MQFLSVFLDWPDWLSLVEEFVDSNVNITQERRVVFLAVMFTWIGNRAHDAAVRELFRYPEIKFSEPRRCEVEAAIRFIVFELVNEYLPQRCEGVGPPDKPGPLFELDKAGGPSKQSIDQRSFPGVERRACPSTGPARAQTPIAERHRHYRRVRAPRLHAPRLLCSICLKRCTQGIYC